jgi:hypothetical protein
VVLRVAVADLLTDLPLALAGVGELVCVFERAGELLAGGGVLAQGGGLVCVEAVAELGQGGGAMLELAHERQAGVGELAALERRWEAVERELDVSAPYIPCPIASSPRTRCGCLAR